jgi:hypothetical protein
LARSNEPKEVGTVRSSQLVFTFGVGALVNLPELSVVVLGLDAWPVDDCLREIPEARFVHDICTKGGKPTARPVRFLVACEHGHLDDFPWSRFVHRGPSDCRCRLELFDTGVQGDLAGALLRCGCGAQRAMLQAISRKDSVAALGPCRGRHPHLEGREEGCSAELRTLLLGTSGSWYSDTLSVLHVPERKDPLRAALLRRWEKFRHVKNLDVIEYKRDCGELGGLPPKASDEEIFAAIQVLKAETSGEEEGKDFSDLLAPEWAAFTAEEPPCQPEFQLRTVACPMPALRGLKRGRLVERLRAVNALVGFSRLTPLSSMAPRGSPYRAPLSRRAPSWVPAAEVRGEGIFLEFEEEELRAWEMEKVVLERWGRLFDAWTSSRARFGGPFLGEEPPPPRYLILHALSHALARHLAAACGYPATALKERIYARQPTTEKGVLPDRGDPTPMAGLLLYTAAADSEGTLGGLVALGEPDRLGTLIRAALKDLEICASDPLCSEAIPDAEGDSPRVAGAACHACLYVPETFCECFNTWLDRSALIATLSHQELAFFGNEP